MTYPVGTYTKTWDGTDDQGRLLPNSSSTVSYTIKVLSDNVTYTWQGVLGNL